MTAVCNNTLEGTMPKQEVDYGAMDVDTAINPEAEETTPKTRRTRTTTYGMLLLFVLSVVLVVAGAGVGVPRSFLRYDTTASIVGAFKPGDIVISCAPNEILCDDRDPSCDDPQCCCEMRCPIFDAKYHNPSDKDAYCLAKGSQTCWSQIHRKCYCQPWGGVPYGQTAEKCKFMKVG